MEPKRILLAENDLDVALFLQSELKKVGYAVETVEDGDAAWARLQSGNYDMFICGQQLPGMSSWKLFSMVFNSPTLNATPTIFIRDYEENDVVGGRRYYDMDVTKSSLLDKAKFAEVIEIIGRMLNFAKPSE